MSTAIRLTMPRTIRKGRHFDAFVLDLFGPSLGEEDISIRKPDEVAPAVRAFGERIRAAHPDASFKINVTIQKGQRKPPGYDAAKAAGDFKDCAFMHLETEDGKPIDAPASAEAQA
jgi:hypothetical protein